MTEVFGQEAINRIEANAKKALIHAEEGDTLRTMLSMLRKLTRHNPVNVVAKKREIAQGVLASKKYVV
ncbi:acyl-CoA dehydrogenase, short-chain specific [Bacillus sp. JCM 19045]|nr:acyl-CoA dehydrogenase, short-chain specific [Bacillus sp. JCM 19045]